MFHVWRVELFQNFPEKMYAGGNVFLYSRQGIAIFSNDTYSQQSPFVSTKFAREI